MDRKGALSALAAYGSWGLLPLYWKQIAQVSSMEILAHRMVWSFVVLALILRRVGVRAEERAAVSGYALSGAMIGGNWLLYIWSVTHEHVLESSLGYFLTPLVSVLCGALIFKERLQPLQKLAVALASLGAAFMVARVEGGQLWISFTLAISFGIYGVLRKRAPLPSLPGMFLETLVLLPFGALYLLWLGRQGEFASGDPGLQFWLAGTGIVTALPLVFFSEAALRLPLSTLGMFQYVSPTMQFLLAVFVYRETFSLDHLLGFGLIWLALAVYTYQGRMGVPGSGAARP